MWGLEIQMRRFVPEEKSELTNEGFRMSKGMGDLLNRYNFEVNLNMVVSLSLPLHMSAIEVLSVLLHSVYIKPIFCTLTKVFFFNILSGIWPIFFSVLLT
jgi:hypothetical protein